MRRFLALISVAMTVAVATLMIGASPANADPSMYGMVHNTRSGGCLDQDFSYGVPHSGVLVWDCNFQQNQKWSIVFEGNNPQDGGIAQVKNFATGNCLDQDFSYGVPHQTVIAWPCNSQRNQQWYVDWDADDFVWLVNVATGECLDQDYSNNVPHSGVIVWPCNDGKNQVWDIYPAG